MLVTLMEDDEDGHDDADEEDLEEENDDKSAKAKLISMTMILIICINILCTRQIGNFLVKDFWAAPPPPDLVQK